MRSTARWSRVPELSRRLRQTTLTHTCVRTKAPPPHSSPPLPCARKEIRTISGFLELISRFEFEFCRRENFFFEGFEFLVFSCECAVACLYPRNSISNVVVSLTVHDNIYTYIYKMYIHIYHCGEKIAKLKLIQNEIIFAN